MSIRWDFWIDCGGTFTDIIAVSSTGNYKTEKLLSQSPHYNSAVLQGVKQILGENFKSEEIGQIRLGTTIATNAFLERKGIDCALITTLGHRDILNIRQQNRPRLFDLDIQKVAPLYRDVTHVKERIDCRGQVITALDEEIAYFELERIFDCGMKSVAISLMHAPLNPIHELQLGEIAQKIGFEYISLSHQVSPISKYIYRSETAVVDAYLTPLLEIYTQQLQKELGNVEILYMQSNGGLCGANALRGQNTLLSGPAGGLIGAVKSCRRRGMEKIITFDMGGTSTDVAIFDGEITLDSEPSFHGLKLLAPMMDIHTVAAGGGSILKFDGDRFVVGPESAGAYPGPACYRNGGPLTVTDANLFLRRLEPQKFPKIFGPNRNEALDEKIVAQKFQELSLQSGMTAQEVAQGFLDVAATTMARAIKKISVERGHDPSEFIMVSFGGAAGQMACKVADAIGIQTILCHPFASVLSAYGIGLANESVQSVARISENLKDLTPAIVAMEFEKLHRQLKRKLPRVESFINYFHMRGVGSDYELPIEADAIEDALGKFQRDYFRLFGVSLESETEVVSLSCTGLVQSGYQNELVIGEKTEKLTGPDVLSINNTCIVFDENWSGIKNEFGEWILSKVQQEQKQTIRNEKIELEIYYQKFQSIAEQMGYTLQNLAHSINIKERNDFSCALFTQSGELLANAPHIPVHLGSMGDAVRAVAQKFNTQIEQGDSFICNDPNFGGTHLPDITVVTPIFCDKQIVLYVASRGHHGDVGGISPGSMPGDSTSLEQEGVVIAPTKIVSKGHFLEQDLSKILMGHTYPVRNPQQNMHDIKAQIAANQKGLQELINLIGQVGIAKVIHMSEVILSYSHKKIQSVLKKFSAGSGEVQITDGRMIKLAMENTGDKLKINFAGTSPCSKNNFNTPLPVVKASILFALRSLIKENIPLNDGIARYLEIDIPEGSLLNPKPDSAVVAGNVETSQVLCDLLFEVLGVKAHSQGTMNNLSFGNDSYQYYETIGGGSGATASAAGASGVQVNMTNSLLTDPEVFESRLPVRLELMGLRHGSGGQGKNNGGDGVYRRLLFLQDSTVSMISQRRVTTPKGIAGGDCAKSGQNIVERTDGSLQMLNECFQMELKSGDRLEIQTPGGGGYGKYEKATGNLVFGYGSNMDIHQIKKRCPSAKFLTRAKLADFELRYTIYSSARQGGVADTYHAPGAYMLGVVYEMNDDDLKALDQIECGGGHYKRVEREVIDDNGKALVVNCYDVNDKDPDIKPTKIYEWLVYSGAYMLGVPEKYLQHIQKFR